MTSSGKVMSSAELQHKKLALAFLPPREDANDISGNVA